MTIEKKTSPKLYADLLFLSKAMSTDKTRYLLCGLYMDTENSCMVTTDGRRMHIVNYDLPDIKQGLYKLHVSAKNISIGEKIDGQFPNYTRVIPKKQYHTIEEWNMPSRKTATGEKSQRIMDIYKTGTIINIEYLDDLSGWSWIVRYTDTSHAFTFEGGERTAILMPMPRD